MRIMVILGSSREGRRGERLARWIAAETGKREDMEIDFVDSRQLGLPFFDETAPVDALDGNFRHDEGKAWGERVRSADGFVIVTPEYNRGIPAVLKNAIDYAWEGWNYKPVSLVGYSNGPWGGTRAVEQLKLIMIGVKALPLPTTVHVPHIGEIITESGIPSDDRVAGSLKRLLDELSIIGTKLKD
jgi:NAD(P)H-dependent FMN reductase